MVAQPSYLPWCGFMGMLDHADVCVLLDTVGFSRQSWQQRNRIRGSHGGPIWLTVPVHARHGTHLNEVGVAGHHWQRKHWTSLAQAYSRAVYWPDLAPILSPVYEQSSWKRLADLNETLIRLLAAQLDIRTPIVRASTLGSTRAGRIERLADLCRLVDADVMLEPRGGTYLEGIDELAPGIRVEWFDYQHPVYPQGDQPWASHLSVVDLLAHCGGQSLGIIRQGVPAIISRS